MHVCVVYYSYLVALSLQEEQQKQEPWGGQVSHLSEYVVSCFFMFC